MHIRRATLEDSEEIRQLFYDTVTAINANDYNAEQVKAWSSGYDNVERWNKRITEQHFFVAGSNGTITGFASLTDDGYLDVFFVHKDHQRQGIAALLLNEIESCAHSIGVKQITSDVSITARPFFEKNGFAVVASQRVEFKDVMFDNYKMAKRYNRREVLSTRRRRAQAEGDIIDTKC
ncbi:GNAT family N-acetyltransferase [Mucilaginibacter limnophilus]|uniref:GNAT family N-acetyltransferase n=1 Tax=Mucilaginibacter limnophilus TaxID=1932778 RepID=A0A3S2V942_9SPHI|nr:GNAT family N-acetyltransferase [Mucilaginibacter limnophilus]RVU01660.1 GNAT family N-acetyltransferase [Mucilaginibacter limnophilus]